MKGVIFDEFVNLVETAFGEEMLDSLIEDNIAQLPSGGSYTSVGTYDTEELLILVTALSERTNTPVPELVKTFGLHLADAFARRFPAFFKQCDSSISFFKTVDEHIHVEVHKLYPDAELPKFTWSQEHDDQLELVYESKRDFSMLAVGLLQGTAKHYGEQIDIKTTPIPSGELTRVKFNITRQ